MAQRKIPVVLHLSVKSVIFQDNMDQMPSPSVKLAVSPNSRGNNPFLTVKPVIFPDDRDGTTFLSVKSVFFPDENSTKLAGVFAAAVKNAQTV